MKLLTITCNTMRLDGGSMYGHIPKPLLEKWTPADALNRIQLACRSLFLQTEDGRLLFTHDFQTACARITQDTSGKYVGQSVDLS